jgi:hypothetical protein
MFVSSIVIIFIAVTCMISAQMRGLGQEERQQCEPGNDEDCAAPDGAASAAGSPVSLADSPCSESVVSVTMNVFVSLSLRIIMIISGAATTY